MPPNIGLVLHPHHDLTDAVETIQNWTASHGAGLIVSERDAERAPDGAQVVAAEALAERVEAVVSLGGDGTMLRALRLVARRPVPVLEEAGTPALELDGTMLRRTLPGERLALRLEPAAGQVVRLDRERFQQRNQVKLSLLDLPFLPEELRELTPGRA